MRPLILLIIWLSIFTPAGSQRLEDGLVLYTPFDGSTLNVVEWGKPENHGARFVSDRYGKAFGAISFDGLDAFLNYGILPVFDPTNFSLSVWMKPASFLEGRSFWSRGGFLGRKLATEYDLETGKWYHVVVVRQGADATLYLNGRQLKEKKDPTVPAFKKRTPFLVGASRNAEGEKYTFFDGELDEMRVYNRGLSELEIKALYHQFSEASTEAEKQPFELTLFPNPVSRLLNLRFGTAADRRIMIMDQSGRQFRYLRTNGDQETVPVAGLPPGTYILRVIEQGMAHTRTFVKTGAVLP